MLCRYLYLLFLLFDISLNGGELFLGLLQLLLSSGKLLTIQVQLSLCHVQLWEGKWAWQGEGPNRKCLSRWSHSCSVYTYLWLSLVDNLTKSYQLTFIFLQNKHEKILKVNCGWEGWRKKEWGREGGRETSLFFLLQIFGGILDTSHHFLQPIISLHFPFLRITMVTKFLRVVISDDANWPGEWLSFFGFLLSR